MRQDVNIIDTWYERTAIRGDARPPLSANVQADACVIGGGLAGLTTALELQRHGISTVLLEASRLACGASGRNGGFVSNGFALGIDQVARRVGLDAAKHLYALSREGTEYMRSTLVTIDPSVKMGEGWRVVRRHADDGSLREDAQALQANYGENVRYCSVEETRAMLVTQRYFESLYFPDAFHIHPLRYALLLARLAEGAGVRIFEGTRALAHQRTGASHCIRTSHGQVNAQHIIYCVSSLDPGLHRASGRAVLPVATYVAVTGPLRQDVIRTGSAVSDTRRAGNYYRLVDESRILWGGRITTRVSQPARLAERMKRDMQTVYPALGNPRIDYSWAGLMGYAIHKMPLIGRDQSGQWFATAFGGHGLNTTAMAGLLLARAIARGDDTYRRFAAFAPQWAFGQLGRLGVQGSYWWMQLQDRRDEAKSRPSP